MKIKTLLFWPKHKDAVSIEPLSHISRGGESRPTDVLNDEVLNYHEGTVDCKTARLMELIGHAIEEWAVEYNLEHLPKKIVFQQALDAMHAIDIMLSDK